MTGRTGARSAEGQLSWELHEDVPPAVERSRAFRKALGLPESLAAPGTLAQVRVILLHRSADRGLQRPCDSGQATQADLAAVDSELGQPMHVR